jgi:hypothetical protein
MQMRFERQEATTTSRTCVLCRRCLVSKLQVGERTKIPDSCPGDERDPETVTQRLTFWILMSCWVIERTCITYRSEYRSKPNNKPGSSLQELV